jgi:hypothetical protein
MQKVSLDFCLGYLEQAARDPKQDLQQLIVELATIQGIAAKTLEKIWWEQND